VQNYCWRVKHLATVKEELSRSKHFLPRGYMYQANDAQNNIWRSLPNLEKITLEWRWRGSHQLDGQWTLFVVPAVVGSGTNSIAASICFTQCSAQRSWLQWVEKF
jgi:hypothetical protein